MFAISVKILLWTMLLAAIVFWPAGTLAYPGGIVFIVLFVLTGAFFVAWLHRYNPALLRERMASPLQRGQKPWDRAFLIGFMIAYMLWIVFMSRDAARNRFAAMPPSLLILGVVLFLLYAVGCWWTLRENGFAAPVVKVQAGHRVIDTGPYAVIRHPMYASAVLLFIAMPLIFGSWAGLVFAPLFIAGIAWRAVKEEKVLREELPGYGDYMQRVRYRLAPRVW